MFAHRLDQAGHRDDRPVGMRGQRLGMKAAATIDHDMHGQQGHASADMAVHHLQCTGGECGGHDRHHDQVDRAQHLFGRFGQAGRAVEDDALIIVQPVDQLAEPLLLVDRVEQMIQTAQRIVGTDQREARDGGLADQALGGNIAGKYGLCLVAMGAAAEQPGRGGLRVEVP